MSGTVAIIPSFNGLALLRRNLPTVLSQSLPFTRVLVVDDGSDDDSREALRVHADVEVLVLERNRGFAVAVNAGIARALADPTTRAVALINNDVALDRDWHREAAAVLYAEPLRGAAATCLLRADAARQVDSAGIDWRAPGWADNFLTGQPLPETAEPCEVLGASAGAALYRRELFEAIGLFDTSLVMYQEDVDLALRARAAGWSTALAPAARGWHVGAGSNRPFPLGGTWADYWNARNRLPVLVASLDRAEWRRNWRSIVAGQVRHALASVRERRSAAVLAGTVRSVTLLPAALRKRRRRRRASALLPVPTSPHTGAGNSAGSGSVGPPADDWSAVSVVIIARDAAGVLPGALASIPGTAEVVVADGASCDATAAVARAHGACVVTQDLAAVREAGGNFDVARNAAARHASREWVFFVDADERVTPALAGEIARAIATGEVDAFDMPRVNLFWGEPVRLLGEDRQLRLVRRGRGRWRGRALHQPMQVDGAVGHLSAPLLHDNVRGWRDVARRFRRDIPVQAAATAAPPGLVATGRIPLRMFRYYYCTNGAWRDGLRGLGISLAYACYHGAVAGAARGRRRA